MNTRLLDSQFERLVRDPSDVRLLKQLAVELGSSVARVRPEWLRHYRIVAAKTLRALEQLEPQSTETTYARGVLSGLLDAAGCAEETQSGDVVLLHEGKTLPDLDPEMIASAHVPEVILESTDCKAELLKPTPEELEQWEVIPWEDYPEFRSYPKDPTPEEAKEIAKSIADVYEWKLLNASNGIGEVDPITWEECEIVNAAAKAAGKPQVWFKKNAGPGVLIPYPPVGAGRIKINAVLCDQVGGNHGRIVEGDEEADAPHIVGPG